MFKGFKIYIEHIPSDKITQALYIPSVQTVCYEHDAVSEINEEILVSCTQPHEGNTARLVLPNSSKQLVLCDVNVNGGKYFSCKVKLLVYMFTMSRKP